MAAVKFCELWVAPLFGLLVCYQFRLLLTHVWLLTHWWTCFIVVDIDHHHFTLSLPCIASPMCTESSKALSISLWPERAASVHMVLNRMQQHLSHHAKMRTTENCFWRKCCFMADGCPAQGTGLHTNVHEVLHSQWYCLLLSFHDKSDQ